MTDSIEALARRALELDEKATAGPWDTWAKFIRLNGSIITISSEDGALIGFSRTALPALAREVLRLLGEIKCVTDFADLACKMTDDHSDRLEAENAALRKVAEAVSEMRGHRLLQGIEDQELLWGSVPGSLWEPMKRAFAALDEFAALEKQ